jgi:hypothetical protein
MPGIAARLEHKMYFSEALLGVLSVLEHAGADDGVECGFGSA